MATYQNADEWQPACHTTTHGGGRGQTAAATPFLAGLDEPPRGPFQGPGGRCDAPHGRANATLLLSPQGGIEWPGGMAYTNGAWSWPVSFLPETPYESYQAAPPGNLELGAAVGAGSPAPSELGIYWGLNQPGAATQPSSYTIDAVQSSPSHRVPVFPYSDAGGAVPYYHDYHRRGECIVWDPAGGVGGTRALAPAQGTVDQPIHVHPIPGTCAPGPATSGPVVEKERRKRGRPRLYLEDGTRVASAGSSKQSAARTSPADKKPLANPPLLDPAAADRTAAGDSSGGTPSPPAAAASQPGPRVADHDKAARTRARNKAAATRYRSKTQTNIARAEEEEREAALQHDAHLAHVCQLREEVFQLKSELLAQAGCGCPLIQAYLSDVTRELASGSSRRDSGSCCAHTGTTSSAATTPGGGYGLWWGGSSGDAGIC
ncbi:hypothetical protein BT67DRAFT_11527 [Trichocladium antarcticum]|uniref:BZIP domain-containing protein n=1 Tax=Trichocladium antarcticum TaxID=1450529 RepID=A0AAN6USP5_9PEZI|nr:hypothetical protein BT67DRAFT_11527 [Trichocladium antarcticum]